MRVDEVSYIRARNLPVNVNRSLSPRLLMGLRHMNENVLKSKRPKTIQKSQYETETFVLDCEIDQERTFAMF